MSEVLSQECKVLLQLLAKDLFKSAGPIEWQTVDLKALYGEAKAQTVIATAFDALPNEAEGSDPEVYAKWQAMAFKIMQQTLNNNYANAKLTELLDNNNVQHCTIKGYSSAYYYPDPSLRQMGDIDFMVYKDDVDNNIKLLADNGFTYIDGEHAFHFEFRKDRVLYEMHIEATQVPEGKEFVLNVLDDIIPKCETVTSSFGAIKIPSKFHHGVVMLMHMQRHMMTGGGIGLRHLCDWAVFVNSVSNKEWIGTFEEGLKKIGLWKFAKTISKTASIYLKMPSKEWFASADEALAEALLNDIFDGGNFGRKNKARGSQRVFINNKYEGRSVLVRFFSGVTKKIYSWCPFYQKYKLLLPIGYIVYAIRILFQTVFKGKKFNMFEIYKKGNEQYNTYSKLRFFEQDK